MSAWAFAKHMGRGGLRGTGLRAADFVSSQTRKWRMRRVRVSRSLSNRPAN